MLRAIERGTFIGNKMFKSKLQELCHQKKWGLPKYCGLKDGPDHNPCFKASVTVNGTSFDTPTICKSSKEAENSAAKLAFLHFTSEKDSSAKGPKIADTCKSPDVHSNTSRGILDKESAAKGPKIVETFKSPDVRSNASSGIHDAPNQYKLMLQIYAQRNKLSIPVYSSEREGPPHALCFKAKVTVDGHTFESSGFYKTLKEAENAAAQVALMSFSLDGFRENGSHFYKNSLQELTQNEGFFLPKYKTIKYGEPHNPTFFSTVEVEQETFHGAAAKSKKQAESNAAKLAYTALTENKASRTANNYSPASSEDKAVAVSRGSEFLTDVDSHENFRSGSPLVSPSTIKVKEQTIESKDEYQKVSPAEKLPAYSKFNSQKFVASPASPNMDEITGNKNSDSSLESPSLSPTGSQSSSSMVTPPDLSTLSIADSNMNKSSGTESYLLNNRFRVYTRFPNMDFPKGTVVLPISEDKWVAVSLEFPKERDA